MAVRSSLVNHMKAHFINGQFTKGKSKDTIAVDNPATGKIIDRVPNGNAQDVDAAVQSANCLRQLEAGEHQREGRAAVKASQRMRRHGHDIIGLLTREQGKPMSENEEKWCGRIRRSARHPLDDL